MRQVNARESLHQRGDRFCLSVVGRWLAEEVPTPSQRLSTRAIRQQTELTDTHEAARHDVEEKAAQKFVGVQRQDRHAVVISVVLPAEPDVAVAVLDEAIIRQGDPLTLTNGRPERNWPVVRSRT